MTVTVNGKGCDVPDDATVAELVASLGHDPSRPGAAVAINGAVVPRSTWTVTRVRAGDRVELLTAAQGG